MQELHSHSRTPHFLRSIQSTRLPKEEITHCGVKSRRQWTTCPTLVRFVSKHTHTHTLYTDNCTYPVNMAAPPFQDDASKRFAELGATNSPDSRDCSVHLWRKRLSEHKSEHFYNEVSLQNAIAIEVESFNPKCTRAERPRRLPASSGVREGRKCRMGAFRFVCGCAPPFDVSLWCTTLTCSAP